MHYHSNNFSHCESIVNFLFPLFYCYDLFFGTKYLFNSHFSIRDKIAIEIALLLRYLKNNIGFGINVLKGLLFIFSGLVHKILRQKNTSSI